MTLVVADTSVILNLCCIKREYLLRSEFGRVVVPDAVASEFLRLTRFSPRFSDLVLPDWIEISHLREDASQVLEPFKLDPGEKAALLLACRVQADAVLIDESIGRRAAAALHLRTLGILGILLRSKARGTIPSVEAEMDRLENIAGFWVHPKIRQQVLEMALEG